MNQAEMKKASKGRLLDRYVELIQRSGMPEPPEIEERSDIRKEILKRMSR
jgi:hypothetical protein